MGGHFGSFVVWPPGERYEVHLFIPRKEGLLQGLAFKTRGGGNTK